jgi:hypothetical protein
MKSTLFWEHKVEYDGIIAMDFDEGLSFFRVLISLPSLPTSTFRSSLLPGRSISAT